MYLTNSQVTNQYLALKICLKACKFYLTMIVPQLK